MELTISIRRGRFMAFLRGVGLPGGSGLARWCVGFAGWSAGLAGWIAG